MNIRAKILQAGFTMIELLVVIAVIGVLAVAVLSSINPIEQINKGRDTRTRTDSGQLINAVDRYFLGAERYPWNVNSVACGDGGTGCDPVLSEAEQLPSTEFPNADRVCTVVDTGVGAGMCRLDQVGGAWMDGLTSTAEVKGGFLDRIRNQTTYSIYAYKEGVGAASFYTCFQPSSLAFRQEAATNCSTGTITDAYPDAVMDAACPGENQGLSTYEPTGDELICLP